jgi:hypothetical protein
VITTRSPVVLKSTPGPLVLPIGAFSSHEARWVQRRRGVNLDAAYGEIPVE